MTSGERSSRKSNKGSRAARSRVTGATTATFERPQLIARTAARREQIMAQMRDQGGGVAVWFTSPEYPRNADAPFTFRSDSSFDYLTAFPEPEAALVMVAGRKSSRSILFCREKNEEREIWDGFRFGPDAAREAFGFDEAWPIESLDSRMPALLADQPALHYALGSDGAIDARVRGWLDTVRARVRSGVTAPVSAVDLRHRIDEMRLVKDDVEIAIMQRAADITAGAHRRAMQATRPGMHEYEVEAELLHEFHRNGSPAPAYGSIVAAGANACILHYRANDAMLRDGDLLLIDAGCEYLGYASDITRTFPVSGHFSGPQRDLYEIVLAAQAAATASVRPGKRFNAAHEAAVKVIARGLVDCGLLAGSVDGAIESGAYRRFYMHRTGHWLGRDVHDCGSYREPGRKMAPNAIEPPSRRLQPGMVVTIEPGIYVRAAPDIDARWHDIGIRIEDDAVVTDSGHHVLTRDAPKTIADIEALMRDGQRLAR